MGLWAIALLLTPAGCRRGNPPALLDVGEQVAVVGEPLVIQLVASDPEGDELTFDFTANEIPDLEATTSLDKNPAGLGIFSFTPLASQIGMHVFEFRVSDGRHRTTLPVPIEVRGAVGVGSMPVFRRPLGAGTVLDLDQTDCLTLTLEIDDPDSASIELTQVAPLIEGAQLMPDNSGRAGTWSWCPARAQIEADDRYTLTLRADDRDNPPVDKHYVIVLRRRSGQDCPGQAPVIEHTPADFTTMLDLPLVAEISDDLGLGALPYAVYATEDPGDPIDFSKTTLVTMELSGGDMVSGTWQGLVPNVAVGQPEGTTVPLFYLISASDDDDAEGDCDHRTDAPPSGTHRVNVTLGGNDTADLCDPCSFDVQCGDDQDLCLPTSAGTGACGRQCSDDAECGNDYVCSPEPVQSVEGAAARQCIPNSGQCGSTGGQCDNDDAEPNDDLDQALEQPLITPGSVTDRVLCEGDEDWYAVQLSEEARIEVQLEGDNPPDMDLALTDADGFFISASTGLTSSESLASDCLEPGSYLLRVYSVFPDDPAGDYAFDLTVDVPACEGPQGGVGDCCIDNNSPGCEEPAVESCVCALDDFCCNVQWDDTCAGIAADSCAACDDSGGDTNEDCCTEQLTPGCTDPDIESCVCALDPFCCNVQWDPTCVGRVGADLCGPACVPDDGDGPCCSLNPTPGCEINSVESCVCMVDPFCCDVGWDSDCVAAIGANGCGTCPS